MKRWYVVQTMVLCGVALSVVMGQERKESEEIMMSENVVQERVSSEVAVLEKARARVSEIAAMVRPQIHYRTLENGIRCVAIRTGVSSQVTIQAAYDVGSAHEVDGERGKAHLLEHMLFKGTYASDGSIDLSETDLNMIVNKYGAQANAFTSTDVTNYYFTLDAANYQHFLPILARCMRSARLDDQHLASELRAVVQEMRMYLDNYERISRETAVSDMLPGNHPYKHPTIGYLEDLASLRGEDLRRFYNKFYRTDRVTLMAIGDVDPEEAFAHMADAFGGIPASQEGGGADPILPVFDPLPVSGLSRTLYREVDHETVFVTAHVPPVQSNEAAAEAIAHLLASMPGNRLTERLVMREKSALSVDVNINVEGTRGTFISFGITPVAGCAEQCVAGVREELERLTTDLYPTEQLAAFLLIAGNEALRLLQDSSEYAAAIALRYYGTRTADVIACSLEAIRDLTPQSIAEVARTAFAPWALHVLYLRPLTEALAPAWERSQEKALESYSALLDSYVRTEPLEGPRAVEMFPEPSPVAVPPLQGAVELVVENGAAIAAVPRFEIPLIALSTTWRSVVADLGFGEGWLRYQLAAALCTERSSAAAERELFRPFLERGASFWFDKGSGNFELVCAPGDYAHLSAYAYELIMNPSWDAELFARVRERLIVELRAVKEELMSCGRAAVTATLYGPQHPYGVSLDEQITLLQKLSLSDIQALHARSFCGAELLATVVGALPAEEACAKTATAVRSIPAGSVCALVQQSLTSCYTARAVSVSLERDQLFYGLVVPVAQPADLRDCAARAIASEICLAGLGSRLGALREASGIFYTAGGVFSRELARGDYAALIIALLTPDRAAEYEAALTALRADWYENGVALHEVKAAVQSLINATIRQHTSYLADAEIYTLLRARGYSLSYESEYVRALQSLTLDEVNEVFRTVLPREGWTTLLVGNCDGIR